MFHHGPPIILLGSFVGIIGGALAFYVTASLLITLLAAAGLLVVTVLILLKTLYQPSEVGPSPAETEPQKPAGP